MRFTKTMENNHVVVTHATRPTPAELVTSCSHFPVAMKKGAVIETAYVADIEALAAAAGGKSSVHIKLARYDDLNSESISEVTHFAGFPVAFDSNIPDGTIELRCGKHVRRTIRNACS